MEFKKKIFSSVTIYTSDLIVYISEENMKIRRWEIWIWLRFYLDMVKFLCSNLWSFCMVIFDTRDLALSCNRIFLGFPFIHQQGLLFYCFHTMHLFFFLLFFLFIQISLSPPMIQSLLLNEFLIRIHILFVFFLFIFNFSHLTWFKE